ncbi:uncharacterized protein LOC115956040 [Quercus lobata]|uniref:Serine/arginine repetitive matrix protein 1-like n=1 Tax=Quercus lobata TaxID=97700 RepID=A0A7N2MC64_QUELO|nr:uncharacterized protein LOC115956040 [Quercus lobata]
MGCCLSTTKTPRDHHYKPGSTTHQRLPVNSPLPEPDLTHVRDNRDPPPPVEDEFESVKEVLSETPFVPKPQNPVPVEDEAEIEEEKKTQVAVETKGLINVLHKAQNEVSEASQISESFTLSTTTTATTITVTEKKEEDEATSKCSREARVPRKRPYTGDLAGRRERAAKSPARRAEPSPEKRRSQGRGMGDVRSRRLNMGTPAGVRRDSGEGSGRRSRSPATRTAGGVGRGGVGRSPGKGTGRAGSRTLDSGLQQQSSTSTTTTTDQGKEELNEGVSKEENESLDNPLVSLECFIFL